jgi:hypothetical protein
MVVDLRIKNQNRLKKENKINLFQNLNIFINSNPVILDDSKKREVLNHKLRIS